MRDSQSGRCQCDNKAVEMACTNTTDSVYEILFKSVRRNGESLKGLIVGVMKAKARKLLSVCCGVAVRCLRSLR